MVAEIMLTKAVDRGTYYKMRAQMMNLHSSLAEALLAHTCAFAGDARRLATKLSRHLV